MNILFITDLYPVRDDEKITPGTLYNFVQCWKKSGHKVDVIKPNFILNSFLRRKPFYKTGQYGEVYNVNYLLPFVGRTRGFEGYDAVIAHMPSGILFADKSGLPFIAGVHNSDLEVLTKPLYKFYFKPRLLQALRNAKAIACRSFVIEKKLLGLYPEFKGKTFAALSGVDEKIILNNNRSFTAGGSKIKVLTVANRKKRKNVDKVVKAVTKDFELTVIGEGYTGWIPQKEVFAKMRESDIFILPSVGETFGMVYLEAMAQGCITVCTSNDGIDGIIKDGENGFTVDPNPESIKTLLLKIKNMSKEELKVISNNAVNTAKKYTAEKCAADYLGKVIK
ncbi:MAG: glycosyltransferase family 4 protein [Heliobacteriaceae bacterium]|jgi:glycosyltransferase involved in cell wall biosynthesis|nr:glycosyltransferase family 4 protein [Heliobacteriaceae bacterium]